MCNAMVKNTHSFKAAKKSFQMVGTTNEIQSML